MEFFNNKWSNQDMKPLFEVKLKNGAVRRVYGAKPNKALVKGLSCQARYAAIKNVNPSKAPKAKRKDT